MITYCLLEKDQEFIFPILTKREMQQTGKALSGERFTITLKARHLSKEDAGNLYNQITTICNAVKIPILDQSPE